MRKLEVLRALLRGQEIPPDQINGRKGVFLELEGDGLPHGLLFLQRELLGKDTPEDQRLELIQIAEEDLRRFRTWRPFELLRMGLTDPSVQIARLEFPSDEFEVLVVEKK